MRLSHAWHIWATTCFDAGKIVAVHDPTISARWNNGTMTWPMVRRVGGTAAACAAALVVIAGHVPAVAHGRPWLTALDRGVLTALVIGLILQSLVPRPVWLATTTVLAVASFASVGRPGHLEAASAITAAIAAPALLLLAVRLLPLGRASLLTAAIAAIATLNLVRALVYDPFADVDCGGLCRHNLLLVSTRLALAHQLGLVAAALITIAAAGVMLQTIRSLRSRQGGSQLPLICAATAAVVLGIDSAVRLASNTLANPGDITVTVLAVTLMATGLVSAALILGALGPLRARRDVDRVARLLARTEAGSDVQTVFRTGFGDPGLRVGYWAEGAGYLDEHGDTVSGTTPGTQIELTSHGLPLAIIVHAPGIVSPELLNQQLGSQARLAIHNARLTFELNRRVDEVGRSRRRVVDVGDAERRRLERDLHDGAQQRLLALSFELRRGERAAIAAKESAAAAAFNAANTLAQTALEQLRDLAHGIHPAALDGEGLHDALMEFAASTGSRTSFTFDVTGPIPASLGSTTYSVLTAVMADANAPVDIAIRCDSERISLAIDGVSDLPQHAIDRAEAVGGSWVRTEHGLEVALPCAS